jgi:hypothetical protein
MCSQRYNSPLEGGGLGGGDRAADLVRRGLSSGCLTPTPAPPFKGEGDYPAYALVPVGKDAILSPYCEPDDFRRCPTNR